MRNEVIELAKMIDHSILHPTFTDADILRECNVAITYNVASVCVKPYAVKQAAGLLKGFDVKVGCVIGFPHGNSTTKVKMFEAKQACEEGATEIDMVINIGKALGGDWEYVENEVKVITDICHSNGALIKVIFENDFVTNNDDKIRLCSICTRAGADFVKTSTGYGFVKQPNGDYNYKGATIPDIELMRMHSGPSVQVKAAGGVRTLDELLAVRDAGACRVGATATAAIITMAVNRFGH